jgi:hypothetical protein
MQLLAFFFVGGLTNRASRRLDDVGLSVEQRGSVLQTMQTFALLVQLFTGGLAVFFALQLTAAATESVSRGWAVAIAAGIVMVYVLFACVAPFWDQLYDEINDHPAVRLPWYDRLVLQLWMKDYGTFFTWVVIFVTLVAQGVTAFLGLPVVKH